MPAPTASTGRGVHPERHDPRDGAEALLGERPVEHDLAALPHARRRTSAARRRRRRTPVACVLPRDLRHGGRHDRQADHRDEQHRRSGVVAGDVAVHREPGPGDPEGEEQDGVQAERDCRSVSSWTRCAELADARDDHQVEEQLLPGRVPFGRLGGGGLVAGMRSGRVMAPVCRGRRRPSRMPGVPRTARAVAQVFWTGDRLLCTVCGDRSPGLHGGVSIPPRTTGPEVERVATRATDEH